MKYLIFTAFGERTALKTARIEAMLSHCLGDSCKIIRRDKVLLQSAYSVVRCGRPWKIPPGPPLKTIRLQFSQELIASQLCERKAEMLTYKDWSSVVFLRRFDGRLVIGLCDRSLERVKYRETHRTRMANSSRSAVRPPNAFASRIVRRLVLISLWRVRIVWNERRGMNPVK